MKLVTLILTSISICSAFSRISVSVSVGVTAFSRNVPSRRAKQGIYISRTLRSEKISGVWKTRDTPA